MFSVGQSSNIGSGVVEIGICGGYTVNKNGPTPASLFLFIFVLFKHKFCRKEPGSSEKANTLTTTTAQSNFLVLY